MKSIPIKPDVNWSCVDLKYKHDDKLNINSRVTTTADNIKLNLVECLKDANDVTTNNYTQLMMTKNMSVGEVLSVDVKSKKYPEQFTTYMLYNAAPFPTGNSMFLKIIEKEASTSTRDYVLGGRTIEDVNYSSYYYEIDRDDDNGIYFNVTLLNDSTLTINHNDNYSNVFMTLNVDNDTGETSVDFEERNLDVPDDSNMFNYILNEESQYLIIYKRIGNKTYYVSPEFKTEIGHVTLQLIEHEQHHFDYPTTAICKTLYRIKQTSQTITPHNNWITYKNFGEQNNTITNSTKSYQHMSNNFLLSIPYKTMNNDDAGCNLLQLKNQITPDNKSTRGNPFPNYLPCDHREYNKLFTGTNQILGHNIQLGYDSYVTTLSLEPDHITYFHTPQDMYPYEKININDSGLIEAGAIGGDSPLVSDKIFKKAADYKYNTPYGAPLDEESGVWLCSWLRSNTGTDWNDQTTYSENILVNFRGKTYRSLQQNTDKQPNVNNQFWLEIQNASPVWVDRYYNPKNYTAEQALQVKGQYYEYESKFEYLVERLRTEKDIVFDKQSDLCFEPGCVYAYYHIGSEENQNIIKTTDYSLVHQGIQPAYLQDRTIYNNPSTTEELTLDGTVYIETKALNKTTNSDFTVSIDIDCDDWSKSLGTQIVGNYTNEGFGLYNNIATTPTITFFWRNSACFYNTDLEHVFTIELDRNVYPWIQQYAQLEGMENIFLLTYDYDIFEYVIHQYDMKGMLVEKHVLTEIPLEDYIVDISIDTECIYIYTDSNRVYKYDVNNERLDLLNVTWPTTIVGDTTKSFNEMSRWVIPFDDKQYRVHANLTTTDMQGNIWYAIDKDIYKMIPDNQKGINASFTGAIQGDAVSLISVEQNQGATQGNKIRLVGDGQKTLQQLIQEWNDANSDNRVESLLTSSLDRVPSAGYVMQLTGGVDRGTLTSIKAFTTQGEIYSIKTDHQDNVYILFEASVEINQTTHQKVYLQKFDTDRVSQFIVCVSDQVNDYFDTGLAIMDIISEYNQNSLNNHILILNQQQAESSNCNVIKYNLDGVLISNQTKELTILREQDITAHKNITNYETLKRIHRDTVRENHLIFKLRYQSYFDTDKTNVKYLKYNTKNLSKGNHNFTMSFNSTNGNLSLFVDGYLEQAVTSDDVYTGAAYKYTKTIHDPLYIGCDSYFNNITLSEFLGMNNYNFTSNCKVSNIRVHNEYVPFNKIKAMSRKSKLIQPITLTLPTNKRSYVDQIDSFTLHRTPGRKSNYFDVDIITDTITDIQTQNSIRIDVSKKINSNTPVNTQLNNINWIKQ